MDFLVLSSVISLIKWLDPAYTSWKKLTIGSKIPLTPLAIKCAKYLAPCVNNEAVYFGVNAKCLDKDMI